MRETEKSPEAIGLCDFTSVPKAQSEIAKHPDIASSHLRSDVTEHRKARWRA
jgi:hypothetical protein